MTAEKVACDQCARAIPAGAAVYSSAGELICPDCVKAAQLVDGDARGASSQRRVRLMLGGTAALVVLLPCAMYLAGLGQLIGETLLIAGTGLVIGGLSLPFIVSRLRRDSRLMPSNIESVVSGLPGGSAWRFGAYLFVAGVVVMTGGGFLRRAAGRAEDERRQSAALARTRADGQQTDQRVADQGALEDEKQRIEHDPARYLEAGDFHYLDDVRLDDTALLARLTVLNKSRFPLWKIAGTIEWMAGDEKLASMPFAVKATIFGGQSSSLSREAGTLTSDPLQTIARKTGARPTRAVVKFTWAVVNEAP